MAADVYGFTASLPRPSQFDAVGGTVSGGIDPVDGISRENLRKALVKKG